MKRYYGVSNIFNEYISDNLQRFKTGIKQGKEPKQFEKDDSKGMMDHPTKSWQMEVGNRPTEI